MSTLDRKPKRGLKALYILLGIVPWIAINYYWIRIGELKNPTWMIVVNALIAFLAFVGPALDRGFRKLRSRD